MAAPGGSHGPRRPLHRLWGQQPPLGARGKTDKEGEGAVLYLTALGGRLAAYDGNPATVKALLETGVDAEARDTHGRTLGALLKTTKLPKAQTLGGG